MSDWARAGVLGRSRMIVDVLRATHRRFVRDRMVDGAAGLAFYMLFSLIPMLLIRVPGRHGRGGARRIHRAV
jgi:uncharacterized BrkB/YihY/UPF0761 family membrane protein